LLPKHYRAEINATSLIEFANLNLRLIFDPSTINGVHARGIMLEERTALLSGAICPMGLGGRNTLRTEGNA